MRDRAAGDPMLIFPPRDPDREAILANNVNDLGSSCKDFEAALLLFDHIEEVAPFDPASSAPRTPDYYLRTYRWPQIPLMAAAVALYKFRAAVVATRKSLEALPDTRNVLGLKSDEPATDWIDETFPAARAARHALTKLRGEEPKTFDQHAIKVGETSALITGTLSGRTVTSLYKGEPFSFELSQASLRKLVALRDRYWDLFRPIDVRYGAVGLDPQTFEPRQAGAEDV